MDKGQIARRESRVCWPAECIPRGHFPLGQSPPGHFPSHIAHFPAVKAKLEKFTLTRTSNNNNNNNKHDNVYGAVIMAEPLREFTRFI